MPSPSPVVTLLVGLGLGIVGPATPAQAPQGGAAVTLPQAFRLGSAPELARVVVITADGSARDAAGNALDLGASIAAAEKDQLLLRADEAVQVERVVTALAAAAAAGHRVVHLGARLPDGTVGALVLGLPREDSAATLELRLSYARPGVPADSVTSLLRRMRSAEIDPFVIGCIAPPEARWGTVLPVLAAVADATVTAATLRCERDARAAAVIAGSPRRLPALDLGPVPLIQVQPQAVPHGSPERLHGPFGLPQRPSEAALASSVVVGGDADLGGCVGQALAWLVQQQLPDGAFARSGERGEAGCTALVLLALHGGGHTMTDGRYRHAVRRAVGWLLASQRGDGAFVDDGPGALREQLLACIALLEAEGLSGNSGVLTGALRDAVVWLVVRRCDDGGFAAREGQPADPETTALATMLCAVANSARVFRFGGNPDVRDVVRWFDEHSAAVGVGPAAELFARGLAGQEVGTDPAMAALCERVANGGDGALPWNACWTTFALRPAGGQPWQRWTVQLDAERAAQTASGDAAGAWPAAGGCTQIETTALRVLTFAARERAR